jgi:hypothetical protein
MTAPLRRPGLAMMIAVGLACGRDARAADAAPAPAAPFPADDVESPARADARAAASGLHTNFFPLPLYATSPAEGSTYGVLPVFMRVDEKGLTRWIFAPSMSWNSAAGWAGTFRYYSFPKNARQWLFIVNAATHINRSVRFDYRDVPGQPKRATLEVFLLGRRNIFYRYFGLGPDTTHAGQSSYTREIALASVRGGLNVLPHVNVGVRGGIRWDKPLYGPIFNLPATQVLYPDAPGLGGGSLATAELSLRFDTRDAGDYDDHGLASELHLARDFGLSHSDSFWRFTWHTRLLVREASFLAGAARFYWTDQSGGAGVPFFYRSALGGDTLFRGFTDDRFIDRGAWEAEAEQRFKLFTTHLFHVTADWRADPFVAVGQVYPDLGSFTSHVRAVVGVGLRAFVHPNVLGRVDVAYGSDGAVAYVILGYPY